MPISAPDRPRSIAALPKFAAVEQILMSAARHIARPAPTHGPLTAAITGCGRSRTACGSAAIASWNRRRSMAGSFSWGIPAPKSRMSRPEQKPRPAPVRTTACTESSAASFANVCFSSESMAPLMALSRSGRFSRSRATPACGELSSSVCHRVTDVGLPSFTDRLRSPYARLQDPHHRSHWSGSRLPLPVLSRQTTRYGASPASAMPPRVRASRKPGSDARR